MKELKPKKIDITNFNEVRNKSMSWGVTEEQLLDAVLQVGAFEEDVKKYLEIIPRTPYLHRVPKGRWRL